MPDFGSTAFVALVVASQPLLWGGLLAVLLGICLPPVARRLLPGPCALTVTRYASLLFRMASRWPYSEFSSVLLRVLLQGSQWLDQEGIEMNRKLVCKRPSRWSRVIIWRRLPVFTW